MKHAIIALLAILAACGPNGPYREYIGQHKSFAFEAPSDWHRETGSDHLIGKDPSSQLAPSISIEREPNGMTLEELKLIAADYARRYKGRDPIFRFSGPEKIVIGGSSGWIYRLERNKTDHIAPGIHRPAELPPGQPIPYHEAIIHVTAPDGKHYVIEFGSPLAQLSRNAAHLEKLLQTFRWLKH